LKYENILFSYLTKKKEIITDIPREIMDLVNKYDFLGIPSSN